MPYLPDAVKADIAIEIPHPARDAGELTFQFQQVAKSFLEHHAPCRYADLSAVLAAVEGFKADFIERILLPYESLKRQENGDVW